MARTTAKTSTKSTNESDAYNKERARILKIINSYKQPCETNVVCMIYKEPDLLRENSNLSISDFTHNIWKVYFEIAREIILVEKKQVLDQVTCNLYLEKHPQLKKVWDENDGYETIETAFKYLKRENFESYLEDLRKWCAVIKLIQKNFLVSEQKLSEFCDMTAEEIYQEYEVYLNDIFVNVNSDVKSYDITDGIFDLIEELDKGEAVGLPYYDLPLLSKEVGGQYLGSITLEGGVSNAGKSSLLRNTVLPSIIFNNERIVCMLNEDGLKKWQRELLVYVANNIIKKDMQKHIVRDGNYSEENKKALYDAANWILENTKNHKITIVPFKRYETAKAIKIIKKYANMGVKYFLLDTFKMDAGKVSEVSWMDMQQKMVDINDAIKPESLNVHILITFQLSKGSTKQRYYTQDNIGVAKNIVDPASTCLMIRDMFEDEFPNGKRELKVYHLGGSKGLSKIPVTLTPNKHYQIIFIVKNREGAANQHQIVIEHDLSRNTIKEIGFCDVPVDF